MDFFKHDLNIDFMGKWRYAVVISGVMLLVSVGSLLTRGLNLGIDFTGGTLIEVAYPQAVDLDNVRSLLSKSDYDQAQVQYFGTSRDLLIYLPPQEGLDSAKLSEAVFSKLRQGNPDVELRRVEYVGPQVGDELAIQGGLAMIYATFGILIYIMLRFHIRFAPGAVMALIHDVFITLGIFSVFQLEFDLTVLAAILAVMGYSLNDTIVVFDRIRENFRKIRKGDAPGDHEHLGEPDALTHGDDILAHPPGGDFAVHLRRRGYSQLFSGLDPGHPGRHLFVDLRGQPRIACPGCQQIGSGSGQEGRSGTRR